MNIERLKRMSGIPYDHSKYVEEREQTSKDLKEMTDLTVTPLTDDEMGDYDPDMAENPFANMDACDTPLGDTQDHDTTIDSLSTAQMSGMDELGAEMSGGMGAFDTDQHLLGVGAEEEEIDDEAEMSDRMDHAMDDVDAGDAEEDDRDDLTKARDSLHDDHNDDFDHMVDQINKATGDVWDDFRDVIVAQIGKSIQKAAQGDGDVMTKLADMLSSMGVDGPVGNEVANMKQRLDGAGKNAPDEDMDMEADAESKMPSDDVDMSADMDAEDNANAEMGMSEGAELADGKPYVSPEEDEEKLKVPAGIMNSMKSAIADHKSKMEYCAKEEKVDKAEFHQKVVDGLTKVADGMGKTQTDFNKAVAYMGTWMDDMVKCVPDNAYKYLVSGGNSKIGLPLMDHYRQARK